MNEFAARLPAALAALGTLLAVYLIGRRAIGEAGALWAVVVLLSSLLFLVIALAFLRPSFVGASQSRDFLAVAFFGAVTKLGTMDHQSNGLAFVAPPAATTLVAAVLPSSRSVQLPAPATAFATVVNTGSNPALNVGNMQDGRAPATDPATDPVVDPAL